MSETFISGTGPIGQGTGKKNAGNLNLASSHWKKLAVCFGQDKGIVWLPGTAPCVLVLPGGHWVVPGGLQVLPGGCWVAEGHKLAVSGKLGKGLYGPLASRGGFGGILPPILGRTWPPGNTWRTTRCCQGVVWWLKGINLMFLES